MQKNIALYTQQIDWKVKSTTNNVVVIFCKLTIKM